ncbi:hypothetical protein JCM10908_005824 [Rhodotorula pacifica]|uniref:uncharacterized protein n=1 Tax=Rhodotorula pacifica TaxID=1495444 RepID=UPI00318016D5
MYHSNALHPNSSAMPSRDGHVAFDKASPRRRTMQEPRQSERARSIGADRATQDYEKATTVEPVVFDAGKLLRPSTSSSSASPSSSQQPRERTRSFLGLGFGSSTAIQSDTEGSGGSARRKISFGPLGQAQGGAAVSSNQPHPYQATAIQPPTSKKSTGGAKAFIRRAKSFGTSPILGSSTDGGFGPANPALSTEPSPFATSPPVPLPALSTSSILIAPANDRYGTTDSPTAFSPSSTTTSLTPTSPYFYADSRASTSSMVLPEAYPVQPHWLFAPAPASGAGSPAASSGGRSSSERGRIGGRRSADIERRKTSEEVETLTKESRGGTGKKGKGKETVETGSAMPKRKPRRATLGSLFGRKDSKASAVDEPVPVLAAGSTAADGGRYLHDSPQDGSAPTFQGPPPAGIPSLPSLPSLQLSKDPYRMSWGFAQGSPTSSPEKRREPRPRVSVSTTPREGSPGPASPVVALTPAEEPPDTDKTVILLPSNAGQALPVPPPLQHAPSTDSTTTLQIRMPGTSTASDTLESAREELKASSPPALRPRSNSYGFPNPNSPRLGYIAGGSSAPLTPSPLASPSAEQDNPLTASTSTMMATTPTGIPPPPSSPLQPSLAKTLIKTRAARSHSDASDRRSPPRADSPFSAVAVGRTPTIGLPRTGSAPLSALPQAVQRGSLGRPATADNATTSTRSSVFGSIGSFFSGGGGGGITSGASLAMSRSASAATTSGSVQTPSASPSLTDGLRDVNEFGALFDGSDRRSSSLARPGTGRKRGLSVGGGGPLGFFGSSGSSSSLIPPASSPNGHGSIQNRGRSGSASSATTSVSGTGSGPLAEVTAGLVVPSSFGGGGGSLGGRMRALTDPNRRFSFAIPGSSGGGGTTDAPASSPGRNANRPRGSSLSAVQAAPYSAPVRKKPRKAPPPREGETPEAYVVRLLEGSPPKQPEWNGQDARESVESLAGEPELNTADYSEEDSSPMPKGELTRILSASADPFHVQALRAFLRLFPFEDLALDVALRVFLCSASLPTETQQIDRVMEAFAQRYCECNPSLFGNLPRKRDVGEEGLSAEGTEENRSGAANGGKREGKEESDIPYVLAFSMVMLNTDHFNPNAKVKMTKADYVRNTRMDGVSPELLEYLYDQITLAPFIYVEETTQASSPSLRAPTPSSQAQLGQSLGPSASSSSFISASGSMNGQAFVNAGTASRGKVDPYQLIASGQTRRLRVDVESMVPPRSPFSFTGTTAFFDTSYLHSLFAHAPVLQITNRSRAPSKSQAGASTGLGASTLATQSDGLDLDSPNPSLFGSPLLPTMSNSTFVDAPKKKDRPPISSLKITKVGLLSRKEDLVEGGKKAPSRKWRGWGVVLTGSQLLFFKDPHFASSLQNALDRAAAAAEPRPDGHVLTFSYPGSFKPDAVLSLAHSVAILDASYAKYRHVFRLIAPAGRQYLFQAHDPDELNSWLHAINFAASFKSAGIKIRPLHPTLPGQAGLYRASPPPSSPRSSLGASVAPPGPSRLVRSQAHGSLAASTDGAPSSRSASPHPSRPPSSRDERPPLPRKSSDGPKSSTSESYSTPSAVPPAAVTLSQVLPAAPAQVAGASLLTTRAESLRTKIGELDAIIRVTKENLQADLRLAKHLAVLTPFRSSTRERILAALPPIEKRVRHHRMQLAKFVGYREVLSRDLLVEDRESERLMRKHSLHRTHSRRTSSVPRQRSHASLSRSNSSRRLKGQDDLTRSTHSRLRPPALAASEADLSPRHSFESALGSLSAADDATDGPQHSLTDDELDRVRTRAPPPMQRSKTETDWERVGPFQGALVLPGKRFGAGEGREAPMNGEGDDELEEHVAGIDRSSRRGSRAGRNDGGPEDEEGAALASPVKPIFGTPPATLDRA